MRNRGVLVYCSECYKVHRFKLSFLLKVLGPDATAFDVETRSYCADCTKALKRKVRPGGSRSVTYKNNHYYD